MLQGGLSEMNFAVGNAFQDPKCIVPILPTIAEIEAHHHVAAQHPAAAFDAVDEFRISDEIVEEHLHFHGAESSRFCLVELKTYLIHQLGYRPALGKSGINGAVWLQLRAQGPTHELVGRQAQLLTGQIMERNVDGSQRV